MKPIYFKKVIIGFFVLLTTINSVYSFNMPDGESNCSYSKYWLGFSVGKNYFGPKFSGNLSYNYYHHLFSLKHSSTSELRFGVENNFNEPRLELKEWDFLYGYCFRNNILEFSFSTGISFLNGVDRAKKISEHQYEKTSVSTIGLPIELDAIFEITNNFGIGIEYNGNINTHKMINSGMIKIKVGCF